MYFAALNKEKKQAQESRITKVKLRLHQGFCRVIVESKIVNLKKHKVKWSLPGAEGGGNKETLDKTFNVSVIQGE